MPYYLKFLYGKLPMNNWEDMWNEYLLHELGFENVISTERDGA